MVVQLGLRAEQTVAKGTQLSQDKNFSLNTSVISNIYFSYKLNEKNPLGLSYGRRITGRATRPQPFQYVA